MEVASNKLVFQAAEPNAVAVHHLCVVTTENKDEFLKYEEDVSKEIFLPSIKDSKLWKIKVIPGRERELVFKITNKLI
jgi:hypothetical protein